jgi:outer membrane protein OmpA-like peptidoglycan-associated protein
MKIARTLLLCASFIFFLTSCAAKSGKSIVVVLLPGPDGKTGQIVVSNQRGSQLIREPEQATEVRSSDVAPSAPFAMNDANVRKNFGDALSVLPSPPIHFILYFHTATTIVTEESRKLLAEILPSVKSYKTTAVSVVGHTDRVGTRKKNYQLGLDRALEIKQLLISQGIDPRIIEVTSHGEDNPLINTMDEVPELRNRRVEVILR